MNNTLYEEQQLLSLIRSDVGLSYVNLASIPTRKPQIAEKVLPILIRELPKTRNESLRLAIYLCLFTPQAAQYLDTIISLWVGEVSPLEFDMLTQVLASIVTPDYAEHIWSICQQRRGRYLDALLLSKLATFPAIENDVKQVIFDILQGGQFRVSDLQYFAKVDDFRVRGWFHAHTNDENATVRNLAKRVVKARQKLPKGITRSATPPIRIVEIDSMEIGLDEYGQAISNVVTKQGLSVPKAVTTGEFLLYLVVNEWVTAEAKDRNGVDVLLWFRLEDIDTVEIVLTKGSRDGERL